MGFDGYAVGGVSVGEPEPEMLKAVEMTVRGAWDRAVKIRAPKGQTVRGGAEVRVRKGRAARVRFG